MKITYDEKGNPVVIRSERSDEPDKTKRNPHKFYDIPYLKDESMDMKLYHTFDINEEVWIEEKIDGANVSCTIDEEGLYRCYGRKYELGDWYSLNGAYEKLLLLENTVRNLIDHNLQLYFEYLSLHHVRYAADKENKLYLIGVRNKTTDKYLLPSEVYHIARILNVEHPAMLYHGPFKNWSIAQGLVGTSMFGAKQGEGVIVKAADKTRGIKMVKIVADDFREIMKYDPTRIQAKIAEGYIKKEKASKIVTPARIRKQLFNMVDEGLIHKVDGISSDEKTIAIKNIGKRIYDDCVKEEPLFVINFGKDFGKYSFALCKDLIERL